MPMVVARRDRDFGSSLFNRVTDALTVTRSNREGTACLTFADGSSFLVEAKILLYRSLLSSWGDGYIHCAAGLGFQALYSKDWLTLVFDGGTSVEVEVRDVKARDGHCRCRFEVMS